jgi:hypothetical protein
MDAEKPANPLYPENMTVIRQETKEKRIPLK